MITRITRHRSTLSLAVLLSTTALLSACSSGQGEAIEPPAPPTGPGTEGPPPETPRTPSVPNDAVTGRPANTGLLGAPRGGVAITALRPATIDLDYLTDANGRSFRYALDDPEYPQALVALGDVNGDGLRDFALATSLRTRVVYGNGSRLPDELALEAAADAPGFTLEQDLQLVALGDVDGDGIDDLAFPTYDPSADATGARVVFGRADDGLAARLSAAPDGVDGFALVDTARRGDIRSIQAAGDVDGDGRGDILVGAYAFNGEDYDAPNAWVIYGSDGGYPATVDLASLDPALGFALVSPLDDAQRAAVYDDIGTGYDARAVGAFDFDGDTLADIAIGASTFDWVANTGALRTYIVFGSAARRTAPLDLRSLDGADGVIVTAPELPYGAGVDDVVALGDVDGDGVDDLAVIDAITGGEEAYILYGSSGGLGARIERTVLPPDAGFALVATSDTGSPTALTGVGDLDGDGHADIGITYPDGAAILYGGSVGSDTRVDLAAPGDADVTVLAGGDGGELVALGDIDADGLDDLGIGWSARAYDTGIVDIGDIDGDGVDDLGIGPSELAYLNLVRVLYGFGPAGIDVVLPDTSGPQPSKRIETSYYDALLAAVESAARAPLDYLDDALAGGATLGPDARACLDGSAGAGAAPVTGFDCRGAALSFAFDWGSGKYQGTAGGRYERVAFDAEGLRAIAYESFPPAGPAPGGNPYQARFTFDREGELALLAPDYLAPPGADEAPSCIVDARTRISTSEAESCSGLIRGVTYALEAIFGTNSEVRDLRFETEG